MEGTLVVADAFEIVTTPSIADQPGVTPAFSGLDGDLTLAGGDAQITGSGTLTVDNDLIINNASSTLDLTGSTVTDSTINILTIDGDFNHTAGTLSINILQNSNNPTTNRITLASTSTFSGMLDLTIPALDITIASNRVFSLNIEDAVGTAIPSYDMATLTLPAGLNITSPVVITNNMGAFDIISYAITSDISNLDATVPYGLEVGSSRTVTVTQNSAINGTSASLIISGGDLNITGSGMLTVANDLIINDANSSLDLTGSTATDSTTALLTVNGLFNHTVGTVSLNVIAGGGSPTTNRIVLSTPPLGSSHTFSGTPEPKCPSVRFHCSS